MGGEDAEGRRGTGFWISRHGCTHAIPFVRAATLDALSSIQDSYAIGDAPGSTFTQVT